MLHLKPDAAPNYTRIVALQRQIGRWTSRPNTDRAVNSISELSVVLTTDKGLRRTENQDRVGTVRIGSDQNGQGGLTAIAVVDGMGGMRDGGPCATLALSSFFSALVAAESMPLTKRAFFALSYANDTVYAFARGAGGATLSAVLVDDLGYAVSVHVGDSRIYAFGRGEDVRRLTVDDTLAEVVGGQGRELIQFVGIGPGITPHIDAVPQDCGSIALTTDGIHYVEQSVFSSILSNANTVMSAAERLVALSRWCGSPDNASGAFFNLPELLNRQRRGADIPIQIWDPFSSVILYSAEAEVPEMFLPPGRPPNVGSEALPKGAPASIKQDAKPPKKRSRPRKPAAKKEELQLEIQIGQDRSESPDGDS